MRRKAAGISAVIAADVAVMSYARQISRRYTFSTQLNISNVEALRFYAQFADVVVLARELNLEQVGRIYRHIREENICVTQRRADTYRDVLPRCPLHGSQRKVLSSHCMR